MRSSLWCWGYNVSGQLGDGTTTRRLTPVRVGLDSNWAQVSAGFVFSAARRSNGTLWAWGNNASGQLGQGTNAPSSTPMQVGTDSNWAAINCGAACAIGRRNNGYLWAWGDNSAGQLGDGTTADQLLPVQTLEGPWSTLTVGAACVLGIRGGIVWSWGTNDFAQLGLPPGTTTITAVPPGPRLPSRAAQSIRALPAVVIQAAALRISLTSALPPVLTVLSGPAVIAPGDSVLTFTGTGDVQIEVSHPGDPAWTSIATQTFTISVQSDSDGDTLPDPWELTHFGHLDHDGADDPDGDGQNNASEFLTGHSPADASQFLILESNGGALLLDFVRPRVIYILESSTDLVAWDRLSENIYEVPGPGALYDERTDAGQRWRCFYRVTVEPAP